jgi:hypothetical protein
MASHEAREQAIKTASQQVTKGSIWLRRAADVQRVQTKPAKAPTPPAQGKKK